MHARRRLLTDHLLQRRDARFASGGDSRNCFGRFDLRSSCIVCSGPPSLLGRTPNTTSQQLILLASQRVA